MFKIGDKAKVNERVKTLYDRHNTPDHWLSKMKSTVGCVGTVMGISSYGEIELKFDNGDCVFYKPQCLELAEEDKVTKINKWEDLDGLENGFGLKIFIDGNDNTLSVGVPWGHNVINRVSLYDVDQNTIQIISKMGFNIEYKPKQTISKVIKEFEGRDKPFEVDKSNYCLFFDKKTNTWSIWECSEFSMLGAKYYTKSVAEEFAKALNEAVEE